MIREPLRVDDMRAIQNDMNISNLRDVTYWALWSSQWQELMRCSEILRTADDKARKSDPSKASHIGRVTWDHIDRIHNG